MVLTYWKACDLIHAAALLSRTGCLSPCTWLLPWSNYKLPANPCRTRKPYHNQLPPIGWKSWRKESSCSQETETQPGINCNTRSPKKSTLNHMAIWKWQITHSTKCLIPQYYRNNWPFEYDCCRVYDCCAPSFVKAFIGVPIFDNR